MKLIQRISLRSLALAGLAALLVAAGVLAATGYEIPWYQMGGIGGQIALGGGYALSSTTGQPGVGIGGGYSLGGGFVSGYQVNIPLLSR